MKIKRKLYPNSNDKEFALMSINDLRNFAFSCYTALLGNSKEVDPVEAIAAYVNLMLVESGLKTPVSHQKRQRKQKTEENVNA